MTQATLDISCATRPRIGQVDCRVRCGWWATPSRILMAVAASPREDPADSYAAELAMACLGANLERSCAEAIAACDARLHCTRGVALALAIVDLNTSRLTLAAVGSISVALLQGEKEYDFGCSNGIVGGGYSLLKPKAMTLVAGDRLVLFSGDMDEFFAWHDTLSRAAQTVDARASAVLDRWARGDEDAAILVYGHGNSDRHQRQTATVNCRDILS